MNETAERQLPPSDRTPAPDTALSPERQELVNELVALQKTMVVRGKQISDNDFAKKLGMGSASRWSLIRSGDYKVKDIGTVFVNLRRSLTKFKTDSHYSDRFAGKEFISNEVFEALFAAVEECQDKPISDRRRIIVLTAPTGGGKSMCAWQLHTRYGAIVNNANAAWTYSTGTKALWQICNSIPFCMGHNSKRGPLEIAILKELQSDKYLLVVDEGEYFGKGIIDSFKRFINESPTVIVILAIKEAYERWNKLYPMEAAQLAMRTHGIYDLSVLTPDLARPFLSKLTWVSSEERDACAKTIVERANLLGSLDLIDATVNRLLAQRRTADRRHFMAGLADECARIGLKESAKFGGGK